MKWFKEVIIGDLQLLISKNYSEELFGIVIETYFSNQYCWTKFVYDTEKEMEETFDVMGEKECKQFIAEIKSQMN